MVDEQSDKFMMTSSSSEPEQGKLDDAIEPLHSQDSSLHDIEKVHTIDPGPPPDGGLTAWLQVVVGFFCLFNSYGMVNTYGVFQDYYTTNFFVGFSQSKISWIGALFGGLQQGMPILFAPFIDKGYIKPMLLVCTLVQSFAFMMLSLCKEYYQIMLAQAVLSGFTGAMFYLCAISAVAPYFSSRRSLAIGIAASGASIGGVIYPVGLTRLVEEVGFQWSSRIVGFIVLVTGMTAFICVKRRLPPRRTGALIDLHAFKELPMMCYAMCLLFSFGSQYSMMYFFQSYANEFAPNAKFAPYATAILNAASTFGRIAPNYVADKIGLFNVQVPALTVCTILGFCWIRMESSGSILAMSVLYGLFSAPFIALQGPISASLTTDMRKLGIRLGFLSVFGGVGALLGPPMAGIILTKYGWLELKIFISCMTASCLFFGICTRQVVAKGKIFVKA